MLMTDKLNRNIYLGIDREQPRTHIRVTPMEICDMPSDF